VVAALVLADPAVPAAGRAAAAPVEAPAALVVAQAQAAPVEALAEEVGRAAHLAEEAEAPAEVTPVVTAVAPVAATDRAHVRETIEY
jgi:hypothetical protein